ncbi:MAG: sugar phosphate nucleotidyltransferase [Lachnospiraceae bacterium]
MNIILLSGGSGKRLWPLSNDARSKQFIKILKKDDGYESMVQRVYRQIKMADPSAHVTIATSKMQASAIRNQLNDQVDICLEPCRKDTFPAVALAAAYLHDVENVAADEVVVVCPVDSYVEDDFFRAVVELAGYVENDRELALLGITPTFPTEKYGYILPERSNGTGASTEACSKCAAGFRGDTVGACNNAVEAGNAVAGNNIAVRQMRRVSAYKEKPNAKEAEAYISQGALWNGGVFAFQLGYILEKANRLLGFCDYDELRSNYNKFQKISFDYAIAEKETNMKVLPFAGEWKDIGTWNTLTEAMEEPVLGKAIVSPDCKNVHVLNDLDVPVLCIGVSDVVITTSPEGILVSDKEQSAHIKPYVEQLSQQVMFAEKSWGDFRVLDVEEGSMTVKVTLNPGHSMNYHSHMHRDEVWTVIAGNGRTIVDGMEQPVNVGDVITMQAGCRHTVIADTELKMIEVQLGKSISVTDKKKYELEET